jgi:predicted O-methyltransferase YrrM
MRLRTSGFQALALSWIAMGIAAGAQAQQPTSGEKPPVNDEPIVVDATRGRELDDTEQVRVRVRNTIVPARSVVVSIEGSTRPEYVLGVVRPNETLEFIVDSRLYVGGFRVYATSGGYGIRQSVRAVGRTRATWNLGINMMKFERLDPSGERAARGLPLTPPLTAAAVAGIALHAPAPYRSDMARTELISDELAAYVSRVGAREHPVLARCRRETHEALPERARMQIAPEQGAFLGLLAKMTGARAALEIGVFTGYSGLAVALALPRDGSLTACEINPDFAALASEYWREAEVANRVELRLGPALETLNALIDEGRAGSYDLAFIDADKQGYDAYYESTLELLRPGGVVTVDNTLWDGRVIDAGDDSADTVAIRAFNEKVATDERVDMTLTTIGDGLTICRKR